MTSGGNRTSLWGEWAGFAVTRWTVVLTAAGEQSGTQRRRALGELAQAYWFPLYAYIRRQGHNVTEAEDLTQGFFARLLEKRSLAAVDREYGFVALAEFFHDRLLQSHYTGFTAPPLNLTRKHSIDIEGCFIVMRNRHGE